MTAPRPRREELEIKRMIDIEIDYAVELKHADDAEQLELPEDDASAQ